MSNLHSFIVLLYMTKLKGLWQAGYTTWVLSDNEGEHEGQNEQAVYRSPGRYMNILFFTSLSIQQNTAVKWSEFQEKQTQ